MDINEGDINLGSKNYSIQTRVIDTSGAGVNAESRRGLAFAACDPLSELVWSPHKGLSTKCANNSADKKPFLLWNVNQVWGSRDETTDDMFVDKAALLQPLENEITKHTTAADAPIKNEQNTPISVLAPLSKNSPLVESFETKNRICLYKAKGKEIALSDGDDDNSVGLFSRGLKRPGCIKDIMQVSKKIKNQIPLCSGADCSFMSWISSMVRSFAASNGEASSSFPMPLACSIDAQDFASLNMGFQTIYQSLYCKDMNILNTIEEKENDSIEESRQLMDVEGTKMLDDLCPSKQIIVGCSTSCSKINFESGMHVVFPFNQKSWEISDEVNQKSSTNNDVSSDLKCCKKLGSSEGMASVFARRLDAFRHIIQSENNVKKDHQKPPICDVNVSAQNTVEIFHAIRNLRLSRVDILRWMNSGVSLSRLNGYFLRLRLKKLEQGLEDASYYVACISAGDDGELINVCTSNKCIFVDVGGIKTCVTSQYVSNHDFLEEEIRAWLCKAVDRGCRVPSIDELNSKFKGRTSLGF